MSKKTVTAKKTAKRTPVSAALKSAIAREFGKGSTLPAVAKTTKTSVHVVAPIYWSLEASALGTIPATPKAILAARKSGNRREVVAFRSGVSVAKVREIETTGNRKPVYTGKGTKKHLAAA